MSVWWIQNTDYKTGNVPRMPSDLAWEGLDISLRKLKLKAGNKNSISQQWHLPQAELISEHFLFIRITARSFHNTRWCTGWLMSRFLCCCRSERWSIVYDEHTMLHFSSLCSFRVFGVLQSSCLLSEYWWDPLPRTDRKLQKWMMNRTLLRRDIRTGCLITPVQFF